MDDLMALIESSDKNRDLVNRFMNLLDRQTDHKLNPCLLLGFLSLFNVLTVMNVVHGNLETNIKEISGSSESKNLTGQSVTDTLASLIKTQETGQPDLMGLLGSVAAKKKINPSLLLTLFSMLASQTGSGASPPANQATETPVNVGTEAQEDKTEKKTSNHKQNAEIRFDRKKE